MTIQSYTNTNGSFSSIPRDVEVPVCATQNRLGGFSSSSGGTFSYNYITPHTQYAFQVLDFSGQPWGIVPVPNQSAFFYGQSDGNLYGGRSLRFYDNFPSAGTFGPVFGNINQMAFKFNTPLAQPLKDSAGNIIYLMDSYAFSSNGHYMILEAFNLGILRIDTFTRQMTLIEKNYTPHYDLGSRPFTTLAIG